MADDAPTMEAYWVRKDGTEEAYLVQFTPRAKGEKGSAKYALAMSQIAEISKTLQPEGVKLKYRKPTH